MATSGRRRMRDYTAPAGAYVPETSETFEGAAVLTAAIIRCGILRRLNREFATSFGAGCTGLPG